MNELKEQIEFVEKQIAFTTNVLGHPRLSDDTKNVLGRVNVKLIEMYENLIDILSKCE